MQTQTREEESCARAETKSTNRLPRQRLWQQECAEATTQLRLPKHFKQDIARISKTLSLGQDATTESKNGHFDQVRVPDSPGGKLRSGFGRRAGEEGAQEV